MFIQFTEDQKRQANEASIVEILEKAGYEVKKSGSQYLWKGEGRTVSILDNLWFDHYSQCGGKTVSFVEKYFGLNYPEAMLMILGEIAGQTVERRTVSNSARVTNPATTSLPEKKPEKAFELPPRNGNMNRVDRYLEETRGIDPHIVEVFEKNNLIYEDAGYHNVVFVGYDRYGFPKHAHKRSSGQNCGWRANQAGSDGRYSFNWRGKSDRVFLFEAPIDMLSYISSHPDRWWEDSYIAACSVSDQALMQALQDRPNLQTIYICFDNDGPGQRAAERLWQKLSASKYNAQILVPQLKDWNEDLLSFRQKEGDALCQMGSPPLSL